MYSIESIGEGDRALKCNTSNSNCCYTPRHGEWYYPNGTKIQIKSENHHFYRNRSDNGEILLNQRTSHTQATITGLYCCKIPDNVNNCGVIQTLCINLGE